MMDAFNVFLYEIGQQLDGTNIEELKYLLKLPKNEKENIKTAIKLFEKLQERLLISKEDLKLLIVGLKTINRNDLAERCREFSNPIKHSQSFMDISSYTNIATPDGENEEISDQLKSVAIKCSSENDICNKTKALIHNSELNNNIQETSVLKLETELCTPMQACPNKISEVDDKCEIDGPNEMEIEGLTSSTSTNVLLRNYQMELAHPAVKGKNCIICAPTGSGKTLTAAYVCKKLIENNEKARIIFIVNIRSLAVQQKEELSKMLGSKVFHIPETSMIMSYFQNYSVLVMTAQILINVLDYGKEFSFSNLDLLIFDECHHTNLDHPYNKLMQIYFKNKYETVDSKLPQIVGITASLGTDGNLDIEKIKDHYVRLSANMDCEEIVVVKQLQNLEELNKHCPKPKINQIMVCKPRNTDIFIERVIELMDSIEKSVSLTKSPTKGTVQYESWIVAERKKMEKIGNKSQDRKLFVCLQALNDSLITYSDLTIECATLCLQEIAMHLDLSNIMQSTSGKNEKLEKLYIQIHELCIYGCKMGIILTRTCYNVKSLSTLIKSNENLKEKVEVFELLGQSHPRYGLTESEQITVIKHMKGIHHSSNKCCLLIATDVAQEGLDLPKCNFVIRYNFVSNEIGTVQSKGRARAKDSLIFLIVDEGSVNLKREKENLERESKMLEALKKIVIEEKDKLLDKIRAAQECDKKCRQDSETFKRSMKTEEPSTVSIVCKNCKQFLCLASSVKRKYSHYICVDEEFKNKTFKEYYEHERSFALDTQKGAVKCNGCNESLGIFVCYKQGSRKEGYTLSKNNIMLKKENEVEYVHMSKTWDKLPFEIQDILDE